MSDDHDFSLRADAFMNEVLTALDDVDADVVDSMLAMGVLTMEFPDRSKCIMNRQAAAHQIWLAFGATAWHFDFDETAAQWTDTKGRGELKTILAQVLSEKAGEPIKI